MAATYAGIEEFHHYDASLLPTDADGALQAVPFTAGLPPGESAERITRLERELEVLQQERMENDQALKAAIARKQQLQRAGLNPRSITPSALKGPAKVAWERAIIADELAQPLRVTE